MLNIEQINHLDEPAAFAQFEQACCAPNWVSAMVTARPFADLEALQSAADQHWQQMQEDDYLAAFDGHPKIGDVSSLKAKYRNTQGEASHEQSGVNQASDAVIQALALANKQYEEKFGFIFIVFASGKSAEQMLALLQQRMPNTRQQEIVNAAQEQAKITRLRLQKMFQTNAASIS